LAWGTTHARVARIGSALLLWGRKGSRQLSRGVPFATDFFAGFGLQLAQAKTRELIQSLEVHVNEA